MPMMLRVLFLLLKMHIQHGDHSVKRREMIYQANDVQYGLAAGIYTSSLKNALETADKLAAGSIWINRYSNISEGTAFGGYKNSGIGREFCRETLNSYTQVKTITIQTQVPEAWFSPLVK